MNEFTQEEIANQRDSYANKMTDSAIYGAVIENVLNLNWTTDEKVELLLQSVPNFSVILSQLSLFKSKGIVSHEDYSNLSKSCLLMANKRDKSSFNPLFLTKNGK